MTRAKEKTPMDATTGRNKKVCEKVSVVIVPRKRTESDFFEGYYAYCAMPAQIDWRALYEVR